MESIRIDILNPKATKLLKSMEELQLISIKSEDADKFLRVVRKLRTKAKLNPPTLDEITKEVERVRARKYAKGKR